MTQFPAYGAWGDVPGISAPLETFENEFINYNSRQPSELPILLSGAARDSGNSSTTMLRAGLALGGPIDAGQTGAYKVKEWSPAATDGSANLLGFLKHSMKVTDANGDNIDKYTPCILGGDLFSDRIIIPGNAAQGVSGNYAALLMLQAGSRFLFDKHPRSLNLPYEFPPLPLSYLGASPITMSADYAGRTWTNAGAVGAITVNLPLPIIGLRYRFHRVVAQSLVIATTSTPTIIGQGNLAADQVTLASDGAYIELLGYSTTQYLVVDGAGTLTLA